MDYSYLISKIYFLSITNNYFSVLGNSCCSILPKWKHQKYGREKPLHLGEREVYFGDYQKIIGNGDWIGNLLKHLYYQNIIFFIIGERDK